MLGSRLGFDVRCECLPSRSQVPRYRTSAHQDRQPTYPNTLSPRYATYHLLPYISERPDIFELPDISELPNISELSNIFELLSIICLPSYATQRLLRQICRIISTFPLPLLPLQLP